MLSQRLESSARARWLGLVVVVAVFIGGAASFLRRQCLWVDEATQMTGLSLGPAGVVRWLAGGEPNDTGQIRDRMPPLSYWLGWGWSRVFGLNEVSLRWFGVACVAVAAALVYEASRRAFGTASAWVAGLLFALSPAVIILSVEIRAYPLFMLWSALAFYGLVRLHASLLGARWTTYMPLALVLPAAVATHFFGAVLAASILAALLVLTGLGSGRLRPIVGLSVLSALTLASLWSIIVASLALPKNGATHGVGFGPRLDGVKNMVVRLVDHETFSGYRPLSIVAVTAALVLIVLALGVARSSRSTGAAVALTLGSGLLVVTAAHLLVTHFNAANSNYNGWMRPGFCILLSAGVASQLVAVRRVAALAFCLLLVVQLSGTYRLALHGDSFAHGPHRAIVELIRARDLHDIAVVHDDSLYRTMLIYHPIRYELGPNLDQYKLVDAAEGSTGVRDYSSGRVIGPATALPHRYLVVVRLRVADPTKPVSRRGPDRTGGDGCLAKALGASAEWRMVSDRLLVAHYGARIDLFERVRPTGEDASRLTQIPVEKPQGTATR